MFNAFDLPSLAEWLVVREFAGPGAAAAANTEGGLRDRDGFSFIGASTPYLKIETAELGFHSLRIGRVQSSGHQYRLVGGHEDWVVIAWPRRGILCASTARGMTTAVPGQALFIPSGTRVVSALPDEGLFASTRLLVSIPSLERALQMGGHSADASFRRALQGQPEAAGVSKLYEAVRALLLGLPERSANRQKSTSFAKIEEGILALVAESLSEAGAFVDPPVEDASLSLVRAAEKYMRESIGVGITIEQLCRSMSVGERTLQLAFQRVRGYSARTYLLDLKLEKARQLLTVGDGAKDVTRAALDVGFSHFGRFAGLYRARYGESPSMTMRRKLLRFSNSQDA